MNLLATIDRFPLAGRIAPIMLTIPVYLMEAKAKRQPTFATSVVGFVGGLRLNRLK